jgi:HK97 family phage portal protein
MSKEAYLQKFVNTYLWNSEKRASLEDPSIPLSSKNIDKYFHVGQMNESGVNVTEDTALTFAAVYRAVVLRGDTIGSLPVHVFENMPDGKKRLATEHPANFLLSREPSEIQSSFIWKQTAQGHHDLYGNSYSKISWNNKQEPTDIRLIDPTTVTPTKLKNKIFYKEIPKDPAEKTVMHKAEDIIHISNYGFSGLVGKGVVAVASESMGGALAQQKFGSRFFKNNAQPSGILSSQGATDQQAQESSKSWNQAHSGTGQAGTAVLRGDWKYDTITIPPEQAQFLQSREFSVVEIARWFGIQPHLLFDLRKSGYNSIEQQSIEFTVYTIMGIVQKWEQELDRKLFTLEQRKANKYYTKFNLNALLRADIKSRGEWFRTLIQNGVMTINEVRELEDMNTTNYGDISFIQKNMQPVNKAEALADKELQNGQ